MPRPCRRVCGPTRPWAGRGRAPAGRRAALESCRAGFPTEGCFGLEPQDLHSAYGLPSVAPTQQTIALVDAYDDPTAEKDLKHYDKEFGLPACTAANGCFTKINAEGATKPLPAVNGGWALEISLDIEVAHAVCQRRCKILLVEAQSSCYRDLEAAENRAVTEGATEISNSWYGREPLTDSAAFNHPGTVITAAAGDEGYLNWAGKEGTGCDEPGLGLANYPASSPHVIAVGGTRLSLNSPANTWKSETVWNEFGATGSGCSARFEAPSWQQELPHWSSVGCGSERAVADIAADADPATGIAVYDSTPNSRGRTGWQEIGGTSASTPLIAAAFALAGGSGGVEYPAKTLYQNALGNNASLHDIESGSNAELEQAASCFGHSICVAASGYDGPTGVGTPNGIGAFERVAEPGKTQSIEFKSTAPGSAAVGGPESTVAASASSGLTVSFYSGAPSVCAVAGSTVSFLSAGTCTVDADQAGGSEYAQAPQMRQSFAVRKGAQTIVFTSSAPAPAVVGGAAYTVAASASSGLAMSYSSATPSVCSVSGSTVGFLQIGTCTINAEPEGSRDYKPAQAEQSFPVKDAQTIVFTSSAPGSAVVGGAAYTVAASASSGLAMSYSSATPSVCTVAGSIVSFVGAGTCTIDAEPEGSADYAPAQAEQSFPVKYAQTIVFTSSAPGSAAVGGAAYTVAASASSGLAMSYSSATPSVCTVAGSIVSFVGAGTCTINAEQEGSADYEPAPQAQQSFAVGPPAVLVVGVSGALPFTATMPLAPNSSFSLRGDPAINSRTGAIRLSASVIQPGTFGWLATFRNGSFGAFQSGRGRCAPGQVALGGRCRPARVIFGSGTLRVVSTGSFKVTIAPSPSAAKALRQALRMRRGLPVIATLTFRSALGGSPVVHARAITDRLGATGRA